MTFFVQNNWRIYFIYRYIYTTPCGKEQSSNLVLINIYMQVNYSRINILSRDYIFTVFSVKLILKGMLYTGKPNFK